MQLQLLAAATAINLKRLLGHQEALGHSRASEPAARQRTVRWFIALLARCPDEIDRLTAADAATGS